MFHGTRHISNNDGHHRNQFVMMNMDALSEDSMRDAPSSNQYYDTDDPSIDATLIVGSDGSVVNPQKTAFLRSLTMSVSDTVNGVGSIKFSDAVTVRRLPSSSSSAHNSPWSSPMIHMVSTVLKKGMINVKQRNKNNVTVGSIEGDASLSQIAVGDAVTAINGKRIGSKYDAERCKNLVKKICRKHRGGKGFVTIQTGNEHGIDTILEATILKPHPEATAEELGLEVWWWKGLVIRNVHMMKMFQHTGLRTDDEIESINGISMSLSDPSRVAEFDLIFRESPLEVTIVVKRNRRY